jgi:thiamine transport system substrate-binding protein
MILQPSRRLFALVLSLGLSVACIAACGTSASDDTTADDTTSEDGASEDAASDDSAASDANGDAEDAPSEGAADDDTDGGTEPTDDESADPVAIEPLGTVRLLTHDSFSVPDGLFDAFTQTSGYEVQVVRGGDAGELVSRVALTNDNPEGDVLFGIDNTFLQRGLDSIEFLPYQSPGLADVPDELELDDQYRVTPIDYGDVCVNYWVDAVPSAPDSLDDLTDPALAAAFVTQDPETSSPGFAFLLATIARFGDDWEDYWQQLADGGLLVTPGWEDAYYGEFIAGGGERSIVTSYASSPAAEVLFASEPLDAPPTDVLDDSCFRQVEFAGILAATEVAEGAQALVDFMLSPTFQETVPLNMFVYPSNETVPLPAEFEDWATVVDDPLTLTPAEIEAGRAEWTARWAEIVLGR